MTEGESQVLKTEVPFFAFENKSVKTLLFYNGWKIHHKKENLHKCYGNHFHKCTLAYTDEDYKEGSENHKCADCKLIELRMFLSVSDEKENNGKKGENNENSRSYPMSNSLRIPVFNAVTESESNNAYADKSESTEYIVKFAFKAEFSVHILSVHNNSA